MERLLYSNSFPFKLHFQRLPNLHPIPTFPSPPSLPASHSFSSRLNPSPCTLPRLIHSVDDFHHDKFRLPLDSGNVSQATPQFWQLIALKLSQQLKVFNVRKVILISAFFLASFHAVNVLPAFATLPSAANAIAGNGLICNELISSAWTGFFAGCLHTLSGPDHLAALAPLSIGRTKLESAAVGALWGCGHDAGQVIFGLLFLLLKDRLHIEVFRTWGTVVVGLTLVAIGAMGIKEALEVSTPSIGLDNVEVVGSPSMVKKKVGFATFATGVVHGLQPDAMMMILPALALPSRVAGAAFLVMFLVGTVVSMGSYTVFIGSCSDALKDVVPRITEKAHMGFINYSYCFRTCNSWYPNFWIQFVLRWNKHHNHYIYVIRQCLNDGCFIPFRFM